MHYMYFSFIFTELGNPSEVMIDLLIEFTILCEKQS